MKKTSLLTAVLLLALASPFAQASTGIFGSYVGIDKNGAGNVFYGAQQPGANYLTAFQGLNLGTFTIGQTLVISGGEVLTFKNGGSNVTGAELQWRVNQTAPTSSIGSFAAINLGFTANATFNDAASNTFTGVGDQKWSNIASTPNVMASLSNGTYELEVFFKSFTSDGDQYSNNGGPNYKATFVVVPEPATVGAGLALVGFAGLQVIRRRKSLAALRS